MKFWLGMLFICGGILRPISSEGAPIVSDDSPGMEHVSSDDSTDNTIFQGTFAKAYQRV